MQKFSVAVIGGGASGILAAISAKRRGKSVVICEKMPRLGKKILASGNGRCNLANDRMDESFYNAASRPLVKSIFPRFNRDRILDFFEKLGLKSYSEYGRIFPVTNQSASVLKLLELELQKLSVLIELNFDVLEASFSKNNFLIKSHDGKIVSSETLIITGGGRSYPALGSDGSAYRLAGKFGHTIIETVPSCVPLVTKDRLCHLLQGQKISARAEALISGKKVSSAGGEVLFTKYGLSGTAILDISDEISVAINRDKRPDVCIGLDMAPFMSEDKLKEDIAQRTAKGLHEDDILTGILPNKFSPALKDLLKTRDAGTIANGIKNKIFRIDATRGWNEAEFTAGGIDTREVNENSLESKLVRHLYFAGEVLDVNGKRGGYNLAWAWASGFVAGLTE